MYIDQIKKKNIAFNKNQNEIIFAISLKSKKVSKNWTVVEENLSKTLRSIFNNTAQNFRVILAGHEKPDIVELSHKKVTFLAVSFPPPSNTRGFSRDKLKKRLVIGKYLRVKNFSGYFVPLDADDWLHYRFVEYINSLPLKKAFVINRGFMSNFYLNEVWLQKEFYKHCGSCMVLYFSKEDFPTGNSRDKGTFSYLTLKRHPKIKQYLRNRRIEYLTIDIPIVFRYFGHGENNMLLKRTLKEDIVAKEFNSIGEAFNNSFYDVFRIIK
ncbi:glycosyltransferase family A protein [Sutcliffiella sp. NPDC057660]|uniref:glycosyltransferase family A protein n=1 Tax=Sutcliffiella sp. NPDC057660 TaxID=3346199 RepID=UPI0036C41A24